MCHGLNSQFVIMDFLLALKINKTLLFSIFFFIPEEISVLFFFPVKTRTHCHRKIFDRNSYCGTTAVTLTHFDNIFNQFYRSRCPITLHLLRLF